MKKKGFTLIELLAVIVILAVIALIATPVIYRIISSSRISAFKNKIYAIDEAANTYYENLMLNGNEDLFTKGADGMYSLTLDLSKESDFEKLNIKKSVEKGLVVITDEGNVSITALDNKLCGSKYSSSEVINMLSIKDDFSCYLLDSSSENMGTSDILKAIQNLSNEVAKLKASNEELKTSNSDLKKSNDSLTETVKALNNKVDKLDIPTLDKIYPVGSVYVSTTLNTTDKVKEALGGTWVAYGSGRVLRGTTGEANVTGGTTGSISLTADNLPSHRHSYTPSGSVTSTFTGTAVNTGSAGSHTHTYSGTTASAGSHTHTGASGNVIPGTTSFPNSTDSRYVIGNSYNTGSAGSHTHTYSGTTASSGSHTHTYSGTTASAGSHTHQVTAKGTVSSSFTGTASNTGYVGNNTSFSVLDPYITVYMYKRTS